MEIIASTYGLYEIEQVFNDMGPGFQARLLGPALGRMARVVRIQAKVRDFGFRDRRRRLGYPEELNTGMYRDLRRSIRSRRIRGRYGGKRFRSGRAAVFAGGPGARQGHLVETGHFGPYPARPHPFLRTALRSTIGQQANEFQISVRQRFPELARRLQRRTLSYSAQASFGRTVSRRARSR